MDGRFIKPITASENSIFIIILYGFIKLMSIDMVTFQPNPGKS